MISLIGARPNRQNSFKIPLFRSDGITESPNFLNHIIPANITDKSDNLKIGIASLSYSGNKTKNFPDSNKFHNRDLSCNFQQTKQVISDQNNNNLRLNQIQELKTVTQPMKEVQNSKYLQGGDGVILVNNTDRSEILTKSPDDKGKRIGGFTTEIFNNGSTSCNGNRIAPSPTSLNTPSEYKNGVMVVTDDQSNPASILVNGNPGKRNNSLKKGIEMEGTCLNGNYDMTEDHVQSLPPPNGLYSDQPPPPHHHHHTRLCRELSMISSSKSRQLFMVTWVKPLLAELVGTLILVYMGTLQSTSGLGIAGAAWTHGLIVAVLIFIFGSISGANLNPIVTLALALCGELKFKKTFFYMVAQLIGALVGSGLYYFSTNSMNYQDAMGGMIGFNVLKHKILNVVICETLLTAIFIFVILSMVLQDKNGQERENAVACYSCYPYPEVPNYIVPFVIGLTLATAIISGGTVSGAGLNPFRVLGPSVIYIVIKGGTNIQAIMQYQYVYYVGELLGTVVAVILYRLLIKQSKRKRY